MICVRETRLYVSLCTHYEIICVRRKLTFFVLLLVPSIPYQSFDMVLEPTIEEENFESNRAPEA